MKTKSLALTTIIVLLTSAVALAQQSKPTTQIGEYRISGPYTHENLTIFLFHGADKLKGKTYLTLQEAMEQNKVIVHETGNVSELAIENTSDADVYVQSGDIIKGGRQDRVLAFDFIVPPKSGKLPISAFCVESGRWSRRGQERAEAFSESTRQVATKELKLAAKADLLHKLESISDIRIGQFNDEQQQQQPQQAQRQAQQQQQQNPQQAVWNGVANAQRQLQDKAEQYVAGKGGDNARRSEQPQELRALAQQRGNMDAQSNRTAEDRLENALSRPQVVSPVSPSSMQLALESKPVQDITEDYVKKLASITNDKGDAVGFAFAINGKLNSADIYASSELFKKLWPKLLRAAATEALAEYQKDQKFAAASVEELKACMTDADKGKSASKEVSPRVKMTTKETEKNVVFDTFDVGRGNSCIHRNFLTKPSQSK